MSYSAVVTHGDASTTLTTDPNSCGKKLLFLISEGSYFLSHRLSLAQAAQQAGYQVCVATAASPQAALIEKAGFEHIPVKHLHRSDLSPFKQFQAVKELTSLYQRIRPDIVHHVAMKPVLYGSFAAKKAKVPRIINAFGGLGYLFSSPSLKARLLQSGIRFPMRAALTQPNSTLILQNKDDEALLRQKKFLARNNVALIPGSGVDTDAFSPTFKAPRSGEMVRVSFVGRLLWDKGIRELCEAALLLQEQSCSVEICIYGDIDPKNPLSLTSEDISHLSQRYPVTFGGSVDDVASVYQASDIAVLPSYREGMPKSLLEAASCGLPLVTTDVPGCREVVANDVNGLLVPPQNSFDLAKALKDLSKNSEQRRRMGFESRQRALSIFSQESINKQTVALYEESDNILCGKMG